MPLKDPVKKKESNEKYRKDLKQHAIDSVTIGKIIVPQKWDVWCSTLKSKAKKYPYSADFTNDVLFAMMTRGCFYCGDIAIGIDRIDSTVGHTPGNCVASCWGCNSSKGAADPAIFARKAYYRARGYYFDHMSDIWFSNKQKPSIACYKRNADKQEIPFDLSKEEWDVLTKGVCEYCHRTPTMRFGIDRVIPSNGYVLKNTVSCCFDCNLDKLDGDVVAMKKRNVRIADRMDAGKLIVQESDRVILHKGTCKTSKKVCVHGKVYSSMKDASRAIGRRDGYVCSSIKKGTCPNAIFEIADNFFEFAINHNLENITKKMYETLLNEMSNDEPDVSI
jgi:hypothetical protein